MKPFSRRPCENQLSAMASQPRLFYRLTLSSLGLVTEGRPCATQRVVGLSRPPSSKNRAVSPLRTEECVHPRMLDAMWGAPPTCLNTLTLLRSAPCPTWKPLDVGECPTRGKAPRSTDSTRSAGQSLDAHASATSPLNIHTVQWYKGSKGWDLHPSWTPWRRRISGPSADVTLQRLSLRPSLGRKSRIDRYSSLLASLAVRKSSVSEGSVRAAATVMKRCEREGGMGCRDAPARWMGARVGASWASVSSSDDSAGRRAAGGAVSE